jgi:hypothetical protein
MVRVSATALSALKLGGLILGIIAILLQLVDVAARVRNRAVYGAKEEQLKYGKDVEEEHDYQNVFMGKCWQLPFCRKFVRERCPIYHSKRTCWRERVGCMCDEEVIRGAMENKAIPRDAVAAAQYIPRSSRLTAPQKAERCRQCVIYNEHQRHKYRLAVPTVLGAFLLIYALFRTPLLAATNRMMQDFDTAVSKIALTSPNRTYQAAVGHDPGVMEEIILVLLVLFVLSQVMKAVEYAIFKLKI